jgi:S-adenosylmethionine:tRNA ribosyltransferase-isomerase
VNTSDFDYTLPPERIAQTPMEPRDASRLLVVQRATGRLEHRVFRDIVEYLRPGDLLVANDSRVIPARLHGRKTTGGQVEIFLLRPVQDPKGFDASRARESFGSEVWECLVGGKGLRPGVRVLIDTQRARSETGPSSAAAQGARSETGPSSVAAQGARSETGPSSAAAQGARSETGLSSVGAQGARSETGLSSVAPMSSGRSLPASRQELTELADIVATIEAELPDGGRLVRFDRPTAEWLYDLGEVPLPPYIHTPLADSERYQTVYSRIDGSAASSTAGLHFTPDLLLDLRARGVGLAFVTLHIGLDTFQPVKVERVEDHPMHSEWASLTSDVARQINETTLAGGRVIAVGTTAVRTLEWAATGAQGLDPYDVTACPWKRTAAFEGETNLFIRPGYRFRAVDAMITNFHLPRSTLLMLVSAFAGKELIDRAYAEAVTEEYRFYSFGDAMVIV